MDFFVGRCNVSTGNGLAHHLGRNDECCIMVGHDMADLDESAGILPWSAKHDSCFRNVLSIVMFHIRTAHG